MLTIYVHYIHYSFDDRQALVSLWTCKCGHIYLYRHEFTLRIDHQALKSLPASSGTGHQLSPQTRPVIE